MKVVLFAGGKGLRIQGNTEAVPKPMVRIGYRPILWHVMRTYAHFGYTDFILCLGYRADVIKEYFLSYQETISNDFVLTGGGREIELLGSDISDWRITFADTGLNATIGERLLAVKPHLAGEEIFLANYGDVLSDVPIDRLVADFAASDAVASLVAVRPKDHPFRIVKTTGDRVTAIEKPGESDLWINGGFLTLRHEIFRYLNPGEELVEEPFARLVAERRLMVHRHHGFWAPMDTLRDLERIEALAAAGCPPWAPWLAPVRASTGGDGTPALPRPTLLRKAGTR